MPRVMKHRASSQWIGVKERIYQLKMGFYCWVRKQIFKKPEFLSSCFQVKG